MEQPPPRQSPHPILVVDTDKEFLSEPRQNGFALFAGSHRQAETILGDREQPLSALFINPDIGSPSWLYVIKSAHLLRPGLAIFLIQGPALKFYHDDLERLGIQQLVEKPVAHGTVVNLLAQAGSIFYPQALSELSQKSEDVVGVPREYRPEHFVPVRIENLRVGTKSYFDIYVKLSASKFVKILRYGDSLASDRVVKYMDKGVTHLYLKRDAQEHYLNYCDHLASLPGRKGAEPAQARVTETLNFGEQTLKFFESHGVNRTSLHYAQRYSTTVQSLAEGIAKRHDLVKDFMSNLALYEHAASATLLAGLLVTDVDIESKPLFEASGLAVLLHDIGLMRASERVLLEDETNMTPDELMLFHEHPNLGAQMLVSVDLPPAAIQAVQQHHMRLAGMGFPKRSGAGRVNRLAELIGLSDELARLIVRAQKEPGLDPLAEMERSVLSGFSAPVVQSFRNVFLAMR